MIIRKLIISIVFVFAFTSCFSFNSCEDPFSDTTDLSKYIKPMIRTFSGTFSGTISEDEDYSYTSSPDGGVETAECSYSGQTFELTLNIDPDMQCWNWEWETDSEGSYRSEEIDCTDAEAGALSAEGSLLLGIDSYVVNGFFSIEKTPYFNDPIKIINSISINDFQNCVNQPESYLEFEIEIPDSELKIAGLILYSYCYNELMNDFLYDERCRLKILQHDV